MNISKVIIFAPGLEQRVSKEAYSFIRRGIPTLVCAETSEGMKEYSDYLKEVVFVPIIVSDKLKRTPLGYKRKKRIREELKKAFSDEGKVLVIARDVNYGYIVGSILRSFDQNKYFFLTDVADNYDLLYKSFKNIIKQIIFKIAFKFLTQKSMKYSNAILIVSKNNYERMQNVYFKELKGKKIILLRNLPIITRNIFNPNKVDKTMVYVGKIDEISRDPFYVLEKLIDMPEYCLHFFSEQKRNTIEKMKQYAVAHKIEERVIFHQRVQYDKLIELISQYKIGLVPHKRSLITDYTVPNKIYDYKTSGLITVFSDCPSLIEENAEFLFGICYSREKDDFIEAVEKANTTVIKKDVTVPEWDDAFDQAYNIIVEELER